MVASRMCIHRRAAAKRLIEGLTKELDEPIVLLVKNKYRMQVNNLPVRHLVPFNETRAAISNDLGDAEKTISLTHFHVNTRQLASV